MSEKYQFDTLRYCQHNAQRMGQMPNGMFVSELIAEEVTWLREELAALREAVAEFLKADDEWYAAHIANDYDGEIMSGEYVKAARAEVDRLVYEGGA